jgi:hypothetical protein
MARNAEFWRETEKMMARNWRVSLHKELKPSSTKNGAAGRI